MYANPAPALAATPSDDAWWRRGGAVAVQTTDAMPVSRTAFWSLVTFTAILLLSPQIWFPVLGTLRIAFLAAGLAVAAHLLQRLAHHPPIPVAPAFVIAMLLVCWSVITIPVSYWPSGSAEILTDLYVKAVVFFWLIGTLVTTGERLRIFAWALILCSVPLAATAIHNYTSGVFLSTRVPGLHRIYGYDGGSGIAGNPNDLALMLNLIIPLAAVMIVSARSAAGRALAGAALLLACVGVIVTFSRAGFLTLATTLALISVWLIRRRAVGKAAVLLLVGVLSVAYLPQGYADRLSTITHIAADRTGSAVGRWKDYGVAMNVVAHNPIVGVGIGQDVLAMNQYRGISDWTSVHNAFLQYAVDLGLPGLVLFVSLYVMCLRSARTAERRARADAALSDLGPLAAGVHIALVGFAVAAFFHPIAYQFYFFTIGGMAVGLARAAGKGPAAREALARDASAGRFDRRLVGATS